MINGLLFLLSFVLTNASAQTKSDTNREVLRTYARVYLEQRRYSAIENMLAPYLKDDEGDVALWNYLGLAQMEIPRYPQACQSLEKAKALSVKIEDKLYTTYNLADCYNREKRDGPSKEQLQEIVDLRGELSESAGGILNLMQRGSIRPGHSLPPLSKSVPKGQWLVSGAMAVGFDSNVLLIEEGVIGSLSLGDHASSFVTPAVQAGYRGIWGEHRFESRYLASFTNYWSDAAKGFNSFYQRADLRIGSGPIQWGMFADVLFLNRNPFQLYNYDIGGSWNHTRKIDETHAWTYEIPVRFQKFVLDGNLNEDNDRTGGQFELRAIYRALRGDGIGSFTTQFVLENQITKGKNYRMSGLSIPFYYALSLPAFSEYDLINTFSGEFSGDWYWQSNNHRKDVSWRFGTGLIRKLMNSWSATFDYYFFRNVSTVGSADYSKDVFSLMVSHDF